MIRHLGTTLGQTERADALAKQYESRLAKASAEAASKPRPIVYFEEWDNPMISGIKWVSELIEISGGREAFPKQADGGAARDRIVTSEHVISAAPDLILASWCGKKVRPEKIATRPGWQSIPAVRNNKIFEIKSPLILQPGPAALTVGLDAIEFALENVRKEVCS